MKNQILSYLEDLKRKANLLKEQIKKSHQLKIIEEEYSYIGKLDAIKNIIASLKLILESSKETMSFYQVAINRTAKAASGKLESFREYESFRKDFNSMKEVLEYLEANYFITNSKQKMFNNFQEEGKHTGFIFSGKYKEDGKTIYTQDWISIAKIYQEKEYITKWKA